MYKCCEFHTTHINASNVFMSTTSNKCTEHIVKRWTAPASSSLLIILSVVAEMWKIKFTIIPCSNTINYVITVCIVVKTLWISLHSRPFECRCHFVFWLAHVLRKIQPIVILSYAQVSFLLLSLPIRIVQKTVCFHFGIHFNLVYKKRAHRQTF